MSSKIFTFLHKYDFFIKTEVHAEATPSWLGIPIVLNNNCPFSLEEFSSYLEKKGVETRPILTGNILRQPVAEKLFPKVFQRILKEQNIYITMVSILAFPLNSQVFK